MNFLSKDIAKNVVTRDSSLLESGVETTESLTSMVVFILSAKKQKHNMTHVEIWLGDGVKTIGARWQKGKVQVFDNYMFDATAYHSPTYIFKSIDTWLMGVCRRLVATQTLMT